MEACLEFKVKRVILTSASAAVSEMKIKTKNCIFNETNWSETKGDHISSYEKSKTLAEKLAWEF